MNDTETTVDSEQASDPVQQREGAGSGVLEKILKVRGFSWFIVTRLFPGVAFVLLALVLVQGNLKSAVSVITDLIHGPMTPGILSLEPPQVYTRERLVNDRFRQANWLENQLDVTNQQDTIDDIGRVLSTISRQTGVDVTIRASTQETEEKTPQNDPDRQHEAPSLAAVGSFGQRLVETDKLRNRLRTDLMDTLLDDGHDLEGNTLYRLNFDAVVMPMIGERRYPGTAVYVIRARNPFAPLSTDACFTEAHGSSTDMLGVEKGSNPLTTSAACEAVLPGDVNDTKAYLRLIKQKQLADDIELLRDWQTEIQQFLTRVVEQRVQTFREHGRLNNPVDPKEDIALDWFLRLALIESFLDAVIFDPEVKALCQSDVVKGAIGSVRDEGGQVNAVATCQNWIAQTLGLEWRYGNRTRSPDFDFSNPLASSIEAAFRRGIRLADHINAVRDEVGQQAYQEHGAADRAEHEPHKDQEHFENDGSQCPDAKVMVSFARTGVSVQSCVDADPQKAISPPPTKSQSSYHDQELKKALVRMITVWDAMREWGLRVEGEPFNQSSVTSAEDAELKLVNALFKYQQADPTEYFVNMSRQQLLEDARSGPSFNSGTEHCFDTFSDAFRGRYNFYRCAMLHASAGQTADNLIAEFVLARLHNALPIYDWKNHLSLSSFVDISLAGCGTTGCRIQVKQHKDVPISEFVGGREFDVSSGPLQDRIQMENLAGSLTPAALFQALIDLGHDKDMGQFFNAMLTQRNGPIKVKLNDAGIAHARRIVENGGLGLVQTSPFFSVRDLNVSQAKQRNEILSCLGLAEELSLADTARAEAYFACRLRHWVDAKRSDLTVYGVNPRAGAGDDLVSSVEEFSRRLAATAPATNTRTARVGATDKMLNARVKANPSVIGFSVPPGQQGRTNMRSEFVDEATFGWAIRPERMAGGEGYLASRHRLSAVISVPSWWKRIEFEVEGCWVMPEQIRKLAKQGSAAQSVQSNWYENLCKNSMKDAQGFGRVFEIQVPRRVAEITDRFNFDFIKAPYFYRDFTLRALRGDGLSLEAGRPGKIVLHGERLWRGTFVTVNHQPANRIVVLPDMKGVVASFECVHPPSGAQHVTKFDPSTPEKRGEAIVESLLVWTSQGSTDPLPVHVYPFTQRAENEKPCWIENN